MPCLLGLSQLASNNIKLKSGANETFYSGVLFRSQLEARWALFFDIVKWDWDYEPCAFRIRPGMEYTPDFYLPNHRLWVEVKGAFWLKSRSIAKMSTAVAGKTRIPLRSEPYGPANKILIAGDMLAETVRGTPTHNIIWDDHSGSAAVSRSILGPDGPTLIGDPWMHIPASGIASRKEPTRAFANSFCNPGRVNGDAPDRFANAYIIAASRFPKSRELKLPDDVRFVVSNRWAGRPLS